MSTVNELNVEPRQDVGNNASRRSRNAGRIPAVVYGKGQEPKLLYVNVGDWESFHHQSETKQVVLVEGGVKTSAIVQDIQRNHLKNYVQHIDFLLEK